MTTHPTGFHIFIRADLAEQIRDMAAKTEQDPRALAEYLLHLGLAYVQREERLAVEREKELEAS